MTQATQFRGSRADVTQAALVLAAIVSGKKSDTLGIGTGFAMALGFAALSDIKDAYITKASGGTDEMGIKWPPLSPKTIANRRIGPRDLKRVDIAQREKIKKRETRKALGRFRLSGLDEKEAVRRARLVGGLKATAETKKTKVQTLGSRNVEILRDRGFLLNSLSPGTLSGSGGLTIYNKPAGEGGEEQIFTAVPGEVIVGTNLVYAGTHQRGNPAKNIPARPFLPDDEHPVPDIWWARWNAIALQALVVSARILLARGAQA